MQVGIGNTNQPILETQRSNQFGPGTVMSFGNAVNNWGWFNLAGNSQTLAGLNAGTITTAAGGVVQNIGQDGVGTTAGTLTLNGSGNYVYNGYLRDMNTGGHTYPLALVMSGSGQQTLAGSNISYSGGTTISSGTLQLGNNSALGAATGALLMNGSGVLDLNGYSPTLGSLTGNTGTILSSLAASCSLTVNLTSGTSNFGGTITNGLGTLSLAKSGAGTEVLTGSNSYSGTTNIYGGTLIVAGTHSGGGAYTVASGATLAGYGTISGGNTVTLNSGATIAPGNYSSSVGTLALPGLTLNGATAQLDLSEYGTSDLLAVNGNLALSGTTKINIDPVNNALTNGTYNLIDFSGTLSGGTSNLQLAGVSSSGQVRQGFTLVITNTSNGVLQLSVTGNAANLVWSGTAGTAWDLTTTKNWNNGGVGDFFYNNDLVTFDDSGSTGSVSLAANVTPASMTFNNNNALTYTLSGPGKILGIGGLTVSGGGTAALANSNGNDYTGATNINNGVLVLGSSNAVHDSIVSVNANNGLAFSPGVGTFVIPELTGWGSLALSDTAGGAVTLSLGGSGASSTYSGSIGGPGSLIQNGAGTFTLSAANTFSGSATVSAGALQLANSAAVQNSTVALNVNNGLVFQSGIGRFALGGLSGSGALSTLDTLLSPVALTIGGNGQNTTFSGAITGLGSLTKAGSGRLWLNSASTNYTGGTTVSGGTLAMSDVTAYTGAGGIAFSNNAALQINADSGVTVDFYNTTFSGTGTLIKTGSGTFYVGAQNQPTYMSLAAGSQILVEGGLMCTSWHDGGGGSTNYWAANKASMTISSGAMFDVWDAPKTIDYLSGSGTLDIGWGNTQTITIGIANGSGTFSGVIQDTFNNGGAAGGGTPILGLAKSGTGTQYLSGPNTYVGGTAIYGGVLSVGSIADSGTSNLSTAGGLVLSGGTLQYTGAAAATTARAFAAANTSGSDIDLPAGSLTITSGFTGYVTSTVMKTGSGTLVLGGSADNSSLILDVEGGTVDFAKSMSSGHAVAGISNIAAGATVVLTGTGGAQIYDGYGGTAYPASIVNMGGGTLDFNGKSDAWARLTGAGLLTNSASGTASIFSIGESGGSSTYGGTIADGAGTLALDKVAGGTFVLAGTSGYSGGSTVNGGVLQFNASSAVPSNGSIVVNSGGVVAVGGNYGTGGALDQPLLNVISPTSSGVVALTTNVSNNLDFNAPGLVSLSLGSIGNNTYSGVITPAANGFLLGGGGGVLTISSSLGGTSNGAYINGNLVFNGSNSNTYGGTTVFNNGTTYFGLTGGAVAVASGGTVQLGTGNTNQPILEMQQPNQFGAGVVLTFGNANGNWGWFNMAGNNQTLAGLNAGTITTAAGAVVQNIGQDGLGTSAGTLTLNGSGNYLYNGYLRDMSSGAHTYTLALAMNGSGDQTLAGSNITYTGPTTISAGTLTLVGVAFSTQSRSYSIGSGGVLSLSLSSVNNSDSGGVSVPSGTTVFSGAGTLQIANGWLGDSNNSAPPAVTISLGAGGLISILSGAGIQNGGYGNTTWTNNQASMYIASGGTLDVWDGQTVHIDGLNGAGTVDKLQGSAGAIVNITLGVAGGSGSFSGNIINPSTYYISLTKTGTGTQTLSGSNTFSGGLTINDNGGIVAATAPGALGAGAITIGSGEGNVVGGEIQLSNNIAVTSVPTVSFAQSRWAANSGGQADIENLSGANSLSANLLINGPGGSGANILSTAGMLTLSGSLENTLASSNAAFTFYGAGNGLVSGVIANGSSSALTSVQMQGSGLWALSNSNTYSGGTTVSGGTLQLGNAAALGASSGSVSVSGGLLDLAGFSPTVGGVTLISGSIANSSTSPATLNGASYNLQSGSISVPLASPSATLTKTTSGLVTLTGASSYGGGTTVSSGTLQLGDGIAVNGSVAGNISDNTALVFANPKYQSFAGVINGNGSLTKTASGTLTLTGANSYSGSTTVTAGVLSAGAANALSSNSAITVSGGTLDVSSYAQTIGAITMGSGGALNLSASNQLTDNGQAAFAGTLNLTNVSSSSGTLMTYSADSGGFTTVDVNGIPIASTNYSLNYQLNALVISPAGSPMWTNTSGGSWNTGSNWSSTPVPNGQGQTAIVNSSPGGPVSITLDTPQTLGTLVLGDSSNSATAFTLAAGLSGNGSLTMDNAASIIVTGGSQTIAANVALAGSLTIAPTAGSTLTISGSVNEITTGTGVVALTDAGTLILSGSNNFSNMVVTNGTLVLTNNEALAAGSSLTIGDASAFAGGPGGANAGAISSGLNEPLADHAYMVPAPSITPVPEPGTLVLVMAGVVAGLTTWRRRRNRGN